MVSVPRGLEHADGRPLQLLDAAASGAVFHAAAAEGANVTSKAELRNLLRNKETFQLLEWRLQADRNGFPIAGIPDAVCIEVGIVRGVIEYKVTDSTQLQMGHRVQLQLYGWLLQEEKFRVSDALCVCVLVPTASARHFAELDGAQRRELSSLLLARARATVEDDPERPNWSVKHHVLDADFWVRLRIFRYERRVATREIDFFTPYWTGSRPAIPSTSFRKCASCLYNSLGRCRYAASDYEAQRQ